MRRQNFAFLPSAKILPQNPFMEIVAGVGPLYLAEKARRVRPDIEQVCESMGNPLHRFPPGWSLC